MENKPRINNRETLHPVIQDRKAAMPIHMGISCEKCHTVHFIVTSDGPMPTLGMYVIPCVVCSRIREFRKETMSRIIRGVSSFQKSILAVRVLSAITDAALRTVELSRASSGHLLAWSSKGWRWAQHSTRLTDAITQMTRLRNFEWSKSHFWT